LAEKSLVFRQQRARGRIGFAEVYAALPRGSVLVSFVRFGRLDSSTARPGPLGVPSGQSDRPAIPSYVAFVLAHGDAIPEVVAIGTATRIDSLVAHWKSEAALGTSLEGRSPRQSETAYRAAGDALRRSVWDPIVAHLHGAARVFVVPDG